MVDFNNIDDIFQIITTDDFQGRVVRPSAIVSREEGQADNILDWILVNVINITSEGQKSSDDLLKEFDDFMRNGEKVTDPELVAKIFRIHTLRGWPEGIDDEYKKSVDSAGNEVMNTTMAQVMGADTSSSVESSGNSYANIFCNSPTISPAVRNAQIVSLFMNTIPSHIMSLAVPKIEIQFDFNRISKEDKDPKLYPGNLKFLVGAKSHSSLGTFDKLIHKGQGALEDTSAKMFNDIFVASQMMVNMNDVRLPTSERYNQVIDPTRPLASLESLSVNVSPTRGFMTNKVVTMTMKLHDRSRLAELADLVKPDNYPLTTVWLGYGWSFPDYIDNVGSRGYGELIRKMYSPREAYGIKNSSFSFTDNGEVTINLDLFTKGYMQCQGFKITSGDANSHLGDGKTKSVHMVMQQIQQMIKTIRVVRDELNLRPISGVDSKEIRAYQLLDAAENNSIPEMSGTDFMKAFDELKKLLSQYMPKTKSGGGKDSNVEDYDLREKSGELLKIVNDMYNKPKPADKKVTFKGGTSTLIKNALEKQFSIALSGHDPYLPTEKTSWFNGNGGNGKHPFVDTIKNYDKNKMEYYSAKQKKMEGEASETLKDFLSPKMKLVSFAKIITTFIAAPLISTGAEVQCIFHMFNNQAGNAANCNIGEFPVEVPIVLDNYRSVVMETGDANVTLEQFLQIVIASSVNDPRGIGYGMREFYEPYKSTDKSAELKKNKENAYETTVRNLSKKLGGYRPPQVVVEIETVNKKKTDDKRSNELSEITRIHFYDKQLNPYKDAEVILRAKDGNGLYMVPSKEYENSISEYSSLVAAASQTKGIAAEQIMRQNETRLEGGASALEKSNDAPGGTLRGASPEAFKEIVSRSMPTIKYGTSNTAILSANLSTKSEDRMATTFMISSMKGGRGSAVNPNGSGVAGIPLMTIPAQLELNTLGCPLLYPVQQYFIDFSSGTTIDNIYTITRLSHNFQPGQFNSSITFTFTDGYARFYGAQTALDQLRFELKKLIDQDESKDDKKKK